MSVKKRKCLLHVKTKIFLDVESRKHNESGQ